jgi:hypothetical protein
MSFIEVRKIGEIKGDGFLRREAARLMLIGLDAGWDKPLPYRLLTEASAYLRP